MKSDTIYWVAIVVLLSLIFLAIVFPIRPLLFIESMILKTGESWENPLYIFGSLVHGVVWSLMGYSPMNDIPVNKKLLDIVKDKNIDDYVRSKYVIDIDGHLTTLHNKGMKVSEESKEKLYPVLVGIIDDTSNSSILRANAAETLAFAGKDNAEVKKYVTKLLDDKDDKVKEGAIKGIYRLNDEVRSKLISMLENRQQYSKEVIYVVMHRLTTEVNKPADAMPYIIEMLNEAKNVEDFTKISRSLQKYNDPKVMEPIIQKLKEFGVQQYERKYFLKNSVLLDYLPLAKKEDKLLILMLIEETYYQIGGDVEVPSHYGKAIDALKPYLADPDRKIQLIVLNIYKEIVDSIKSENIESARKEGMSKLEDMKLVLAEQLEEINDKEAKEYKNFVEECMTIRGVPAEKSAENDYAELRKRINSILTDIDVLEKVQKKVQE